MGILERIHAGEVLISDGATGTNLQRRGLVMGQAAERWVLERPDEIILLHRNFINAGSDILLTCTFGGTSIRLEHLSLGEQAENINCKAVELTRRAIEVESPQRPVYIAGSIGPTGHLLKPLGKLDEEDAYQAFRHQASALAQAGIDLFVVETQFDLAEASLAVRAVRSVSGLPLVCSFSYDRGVRTMMGVKPSQFASESADWGIDLVGINCGRSLEENFKVLTDLRKNSDLPIWFKPNAGMPQLDAEGKPTYSLSPENMAAEVRNWVQAGASVIGGCCGTSPEHLQAIAAAVRA